MGSIASVSQEGTAYLIRQAYEAGEKWQWAREALVNGLQAGATYVEFGIEPQGFKSKGVLRRYIADNGIGMSPDNIKIFLMSFGGGGRPIGLTQNFGQGFKSSCYEWNPYGIIVSSWTKDDPEGCMIWIHRVTRAGKIFWELRDFETDEGTMEDVIAPCFLEEIGVDVAALKTPEIEAAGQGTVFLFLGQNPGEDTHRGDVDRGEDKVKRGTIIYINSRFLTIPEGVTVRVAEVEGSAVRQQGSWKKDYLESPSGDFLSVDWRRARGALAYVPGDAQRGRFKLKHDTWVDWYLANDDVITKGQTDGPSSPHICLAYEHETYERKTTVRDYRPFGLIEEFKNRLWLVLTPPKYNDGQPDWGVFPQGSRGQLLSKGGTQLPWADWEDSFAANLPRPIQAALDEFRKSRTSPADSTQRRERLKRIAARLATRFRPTNLIENAFGRTAGTDSGTRTGQPRVGVKPKRPTKPEPSDRSPSQQRDTGGAGDTAVLNEDRDGEYFGAVRRSSDGIPATAWDPKFPEDEFAYAVRFDKGDCVDGSFGTVHFNLSFPLFESEFLYWSEQYPKAASNEIVDLVKSVYEDEVISKIMHAQKMSGQPLHTSEGSVERVNNANIESWTSPDALTSAVLGLINVEQRINVLAGSRFGKKKPA
jgi:hypothetical protein